MIYNSVSVGTVIVKIFRDLGIRGEHWVNDAIEWSAEALEQIGAFSQLEKRVAIIPILSHKGPLPLDMVQLLGVFTTYDSEVSDFEDFTTSNKIPVGYSNSTFNQALFPEFVDTTNRTSGNLVQYDIKGGYIHSPNEKDYILISYLAMPVSEEDGFPLIPNKIEYREALLWYILSKLLMSGRYVSPNREITYSFAYQQWQRYCTQARNSANMLDIPQAENFLNNWVTNLQRDRFAQNFGSDVGYFSQVYGSGGTSVNALDDSASSTSLNTNADLFDNNSIRIAVSDTSISAGNSVFVNLDYDLEGHTVSYRNLAETPYISDVTDPFAGYVAEITFATPGSYAIKALITRDSTGETVNTVNNVIVTVS